MLTQITVKWPHQIPSKYRLQTFTGKVMPPDDPFTLRLRTSSPLWPEAIIPLSHIVERNDGVKGNEDDGISADVGSTVSGNTVYQNGLDGIFALAGSTVSGNTSNQNGDDGIFASGGSTVSGNTLRSNGGYGLRLLPDDAYRANVITSNTTGAVLNGANRGDNYCQGPGVVSSFCP